MFADIMKKVAEEQYNSFASNIGDKKKISRRKYLVVFFKTFLGYETYDARYGLTFNKFYHKQVDSVSLCGPEIEFFNNMIDVKLKKSENYITSWIKLFNETNNLIKCQLGPNILKCLLAKPDLKVVNMKVKKKTK